MMGSRLLQAYQKHRRVQPFSQTKRRNCVTLTSISERQIPLPSSNSFSLAYVWTLAERPTCSAGDWALLSHHMKESTQEVSIDMAINKWYVVCSVGDLGESEDTRPSETLCHRISAPVHDSDYRCFRCSPTELYDLAQWLSWQHENPIVVPRTQEQGQFTDVDLDHPLTTENFDQCKESLLDSLRIQSAREMFICLAALYFVSYNLRKWTPTELVAAVQWVSETYVCSDSNELPGNNEIVTTHMLSKICGTFMYCTSDGTLTFRNKHMASFIRTIELPGLEHGHALMAELCLQQLSEVGAMMLLRPWYNFCKWSDNVEQWPLIEYAARYWFIHYKLAVEDQPDLTAELIRMINSALTGHDPSATKILLQCKAVTAGLAVAEAYDLPCLAEVYNNMGATGGYHLNKTPSDEEWGEMALVYRVDCSIDSRSRGRTHADKGSDELLSRFQTLNISSADPLGSTRCATTELQIGGNRGQDTPCKEWVFV